MKQAKQKELFPGNDSKIKINFNEIHSAYSDAVLSGSFSLSQVEFVHNVRKFYRFFLYSLRKNDSVFDLLLILAALQSFNPSDTFFQEMASSFQETVDSEPFVIVKDK